MRLLSKKVDRGCLAEFSIGFWIPASSPVYQLVVRRRGPVERKGRSRGKRGGLEKYISRRIRLCDRRPLRWPGGGGGCGGWWRSKV